MINNAQKYLLIAATVILGSLFMRKQAAHDREMRRAENTRAAAAQSAAQERNARILEVRATLVTTLKDPQSAQIRSQQWVAESQTLCGEINAKNSFGGYVGFKRFVAQSHQVLIEGSGFRGFDVRHLNLPDYTAAAMKLADAKPVEQEAMAIDVFNMIWAASCSGGWPVPPS